MASTFGHEQNRRLASFLYAQGIRYSTYTKKKAHAAVWGTVAAKRFKQMIEADSRHIREKLKAIHRNPALYSLKKQQPGAPGFPKHRKYGGKIYDLDSVHTHKKYAEQTAKRLRQSGFLCRIAKGRNTYGERWIVYRKIK